jgi:DNA-binding LacI/PurR family transcriptional regulator
VTIKDVVKKSGVSIVTVSKYLNGVTVRPKSAVKIKDAINQLGYKVNQSARSLKTNKSMMIGIVVDSIQNPFYARIASLIIRRLQVLNYSTMICENNEDAGILKNQLEFLRGRGVDGIIIFSTNLPAALIEEFYEKFSNIVVVDSIIRNVGCDYIVSDNISGAYHATEHFIAKGHRNIAIITGEKKHFSARERLNGYVKALKDYDIPINKDFIFHDLYYDINGGYNAFKKIIAMFSKQNSPTAVLIADYFMTVGSIIAINEANLNVPKDISVICFDNFDLNKVFKPQFTYINQQEEEMSRIAVEFLLDRIKKEIRESRIVRLPPQMLHGASVKNIPLHHPSP